MDAHQGVLLQAIWDLTVSDAAWPNFNKLDRHLYREHSLEAAPLIAAAGPVLVIGGQRQGGAPPDPNGEVALTVVGLASCHGTEEVLASVVRALRASVVADKTAPSDLEPTVRANEAIDGASDGTARATTPEAARLARLTGLVLSKESWRSQITLHEDGWRLTVDGRIRAYRDVNTVPQFLAQRKRELESRASPMDILISGTPLSHITGEAMDDESAVGDDGTSSRQSRGAETASEPTATNPRVGPLRTAALTAVITTLITVPLTAILSNGSSRLFEAYTNARTVDSAEVLDYVKPDGLTDDGSVKVVGDELEVSGQLLQPLPRGRVLYTASRIASAGTGPRINDGPVGYGLLPCDVDEVAKTFSCDRRPLGSADDAGENFYVWLIMPNASQLRDIISRVKDQEATGKLQDPPGPAWVSPTYYFLRK